MTLEELFPELASSGLSTDMMPIVTFDVPVEMLEEAGVRLDESTWQDAHISGMKYRIDAARPDMKQRRHVHVAADKHVNSPKKQASWNDDGKRHDKKNFNSKLGAQHAYRDVARAALGLPDNVILEAVEAPANTSRVRTILESLGEPVIDLHFRVSPPRRLKGFKEFLKEG